MMSNDTEKVKVALWEGSLPIELSLDPGEISSSRRPPPLYVMVSRMSYISCIMDDVVSHFSHAVMDAMRMLWFEDPSTGKALRWHLPLGVLHDLRESPRSLPWKLTAHFSNFPFSEILPFENMEAVKRHYMHALKQSLALQHGRAKEAMDMPKTLQNRLWEALASGNGESFLATEAALGEGNAAVSGMKRVPMRICMQGRPTLQVPIPASGPSGDTTIHDCLRLYFPDAVDLPSSVTIHGIDVPLEASAMEVWSLLRHPDRFMYVTLRSPSGSTERQPPVLPAPPPTVKR